MDLSPLGRVVAEEWEKTPKIRPYVTLDAWVVMPNHVHGILLIEPPRLDGRPRPLGEVIGQFKGVSTRRIRAEGACDFDWQPRFFDQIIPDEQTLLQFRKYILENPLHWEKDKHHPDKNRPAIVSAPSQ